MEPEYMIAGHSAGVAAAMASKNNVAVQKIDIKELQSRLLQQGQILSFGDNPNGYFQQGNTVIVDDDNTRFVEKWGSWTLSENPDVVRHAITYYINSDKEWASITYQPHLPKAGNYKVYGWWAKDSKAATNVPLTIDFSGGTKIISANQKQTGDGWVLLGTYPFEAGKKGKVTITNQGVDGVVEADAFKFELAK
jgi:hypothetical protein